MEAKSPTSCTICLGDLDGKRLTKTKCGHEFCSDCILNNIALSKTNKNKCPNCREDICPPVKPSIGWSTQLHIEHLEEEVLSLSRQRHSLKKTNNELVSKNQKNTRDIFKLKYKNAELTGKCEYYTIKYHENLKQKLLLMDANRKLRGQLKLCQTRLADNVGMFRTGGLLQHCSICSKSGHSKEECAIIGCSPCLNCKGEHDMKQCPAFLRVILSDFIDEASIDLRLVEDGYYDEEENRIQLESAVFQNQHESQVVDNILSSDSDDSLPDLIPMSSVVPTYNHESSVFYSPPPLRIGSRTAWSIQRSMSGTMGPHPYDSIREANRQIIEAASRSPQTESGHQDVVEPVELD